MARPISDAWFHRVKSATRDLVKACGGLVRSGEIVHASKTEVGRWQSATDEDIIPLPAAMALEAECGIPFVLNAYAGLLGRRVADPAEEGGAAASVFVRHAEAVGAAAEMMAAGAAAAADNRLTPAEAERMDRAAGSLEGSIGLLRRDLAAAKAGSLRVVGGDE